MEYSINEKIQSNKIRIKNYGDGKEITKKEAISIAQDNDMDLIQINTNNHMAICIIDNYDHYLYKIKKLAKQKKKINNKLKKSQIKEIRFKINTTHHDLEYKARQVDNFLQHNIKVKISINLYGKEKLRKNDASKDWW